MKKVLIIVVLGSLLLLSAMLAATPIQKALTVHSTIINEVKNLRIVVIPVPDIKSPPPTIEIKITPLKTDAYKGTAMIIATNDSAMTGNFAVKVSTDDGQTFVDNAKITALAAGATSSASASLPVGVDQIAVLTNREGKITVVLLLDG